MQSLRSWLHTGWSWLVGTSPNDDQKGQAEPKQRQRPSQGMVDCASTKHPDQTPDKTQGPNGAPVTDAGFSFAPATAAYPHQEQANASTSSDGTSTPIMVAGVRQEEAAEPTPKPLGERFVVKDGTTVGLENTVRRYAPHRPVTLHSTPFDKRLDAQLQREMEVLQAVAHIHPSNSSPGKACADSFATPPRLALAECTNSQGA